MIARNDNMEIQPTLQRQLAPKLESHNESTSLPTATYTADHNSFSHKNFTLPQSFRRYDPHAPKFRLYLCLVTEASYTITDNGKDGLAG